MQTFMPYPSFKESAKVLDMKRLGKQRVEVLQILQCLKGEKTGWRNHPAVKMWKGHENALIEYGIAICDEWLRRGYRDSIRQRLWEKYPWHQTAPKPEWFGNLSFHKSHQSNLLRKNKEYYSQFGWDISDSLPYVWPTKQQHE